MRPRFFIACEAECFRHDDERDRLYADGSATPRNAGREMRIARHWHRDWIARFLTVRFFSWKSCIEVAAAAPNRVRG
jgi:hypothetical protein